MITNQAGAIDYLNTHHVLAEVFNSFDNAFDYGPFDTAFTDDVVFNIFMSGDTRKNGVPDTSAAGRANVIALFKQFFRSIEQTHHTMSNYTVRTDNDVAHAAAHVRAHHKGKGSVSHLYEESLAISEVTMIRKNGAWAIRKFDYTMLIILGSMEVFGGVA